MSSAKTSKTEADEDSSVKLYGRLLAYIKPIRFALLASILGYVIYSASSLRFLELLEQMIDSIGKGEQITSEMRLVFPITLLILVAVRGLGSYLGAFYMAYLANNIVHRLRTQLVERFLTLPISFYDKRTSGHLLSTVTFNVNQVNLAVSDALTVILREGLLVLGLVGYLFWKNWQLTLIFVAVVPAVSGVVLYASKKFRKYSNRIQISMGDVTHILTETIKGFKVIRSFGAEKQVNNNFIEASELNLKQNLKMASVAAISTPVIQLVVGSALAILVWFAMSPKALNGITAGEFVVFISAAASLLKPIRQLSKINVVIQRGLAAAKTIFDLVDEQTENDTGAYQTERVKGRVEFKNVSFAYDSQPPENQEGVQSTQAQAKSVLNNINFICEPGQTVAFVGKSGSGKTTLVNLIARFYELNSGTILIDDHSHTEFTLNNLRQQIALVSQQVVLFSGSIRDNIAYGSLANATDNDILEALKNANAMEFIDTFPDGIATKVGDDATLLSGGQRQRLAIARALLKDAPILILDEATSALDSVSERNIQSALETLMVGRTTFVIAHRLSTIEKADIIIVMNEGEIVETGTHDELLTLGNHYAALHKMQFTES